MRKYIFGSPEDISKFEAQLHRMHSQEDLVIAGSFGRAAMYATFQADASPVSLRRERGGLHDIDVLTVGRYWKEADEGGGPHPVDSELGVFFDRNASVPTLINGMVELDPQIFRTHIRSLDGSAVRTFSVGTQLQLNRYVARMMDWFDPSKTAKYAPDLEAFEAFAEDLRRDHEYEFLSDALYEPLHSAPLD